MMKKTLISLLSVGMFLGLFGAIGESSNILPNVTEEQTVQADTTNDSKTIHYEVYKRNSNTLSTMNNLFTKSATIDPIDGGGYKVTLTTRDGVVSGLNFKDIDNQTPTVTNDGLHHSKISFKVASLNDLDSNIPADLEWKTKLLSLDLDNQAVDFKFDLSSLDGSGTNTFADSLNKITNADNDFTNSANDIKGLVSDLKSNNSNDNNILSTPKDSTDATTDTSDNQTTTDNSSDTNTTDPKTILKELTYKVAKNNGDGSLVSPYFTNTAKVMQNPDGSYYVETTIKYPKKFGNKAFEINYVNNQKPFNINFRSEGDSNYLTFDFPIKSLTDLGNLIPGDITLNIPDFGFNNKNLGFKLNFDAINPSDLSNLMSNTDTTGLSNLISNLGSLSKLGTVTTTPSTNNNSKTTANTNDNKQQAAATLPQTGNETNDILMVIGGAVLIMVIVLLKGTYLKN